MGEVVSSEAAAVRASLEPSSVLSLRKAKNFRAGSELVMSELW